MEPEPVDKVKGIAIGKADIQQKHIGLEGEEPIHRFLEGVSDMNFDGFAGEDSGDRRCKFGVWLNQEKGGFFSGLAEQAREIGKELVIPGVQIDRCWRPNGCGGIGWVGSECGRNSRSDAVGGEFSVGSVFDAGEHDERARIAVKAM